MNSVSEQREVSIRTPFNRHEAKSKMDRRFFDKGMGKWVRVDPQASTTLAWLRSN